MAERFDVAIVGAGPAGLSAAIMLGRCRRKVVVFDHGKPRNYAAQGVHGYLGLDDITPEGLRAAGRRMALDHGVTFRDVEVTGGRCVVSTTENTLFELQLKGGECLEARKLLLATGTKDALPEIQNVDQFYGVSIHHCPYCDGWEQRDRRLVALGKGQSGVNLAIQLLAWSRSVAACTDGEAVSDDDRRRLARHSIELYEPPILRAEGQGSRLERVILEGGGVLACDALFFSGHQTQRSTLPMLFGCQCDEKGLLCREGKQGSGVPGVFLAGDADGDVQFAIVAAAEGATAATAIHRELQDEDT